MNAYDLLNLDKLDKKEKIEKAIQETKMELRNFPVEQACIIYSNALRKNLARNHVLNRSIDTKDYEYPYSHHFNLVPIDEEHLYLIDLTFAQFHRDGFPELLEKGYTVVDENTFPTYMRIVGNSDKPVSLKEVFETEAVRRR